MSSLIKFISLAVAITSITQNSIAAKLLFLQRGQPQDLQQYFSIDAPGLNQSALNKANSLPKKNSLKFITQNKDKNKLHHMRFQQKYKGFLVNGGYAIAHTKEPIVQSLLSTNLPVKLSGVLYQNLEEDLGDPPANFVARGAQALAEFKKSFTKKHIIFEQVEPLVFIDNNSRAHWAYKITVFLGSEDERPEKPSAIVDALSFKPFVKWNEIKTISLQKVYGLGYGGNSKMGRYVYGRTHPFLSLMRDQKTKMCFMENKEVSVVDMGNRYYSSNKPAKFSCSKELDAKNHVFWTGYNGNGYDEINGGYSPMNDALFVGSMIKKMYLDWFGIEVLKKPDGSPMKLIMRVHYGLNYENAYWDGEQMTFGDGAEITYPFVSIGIGAHEISHGFTEQHSNLAYYGQSGGLNESFSDMAAQAAEYYATGQNSWLIGHEILKEGTGYEALRYMNQPSLDGRSIDVATDYHDSLDVHLSSGVYNRFFYLLANKPGWDVRQAFDVMVKANMNYWTPYDNFEQAACGVLSAAKDLKTPIDGLKEAFMEVNISTESCE